MLFPLDAEMFIVLDKVCMLVAHQYAARSKVAYSSLSTAGLRHAVRMRKGSAFRSDIARKLGQVFGLVQTLPCWAVGCQSQRWTAQGCRHRSSHPYPSWKAAEKVPWMPAAAALVDPPAAWNPASDFVSWQLHVYMIRCIQLQPSFHLDPMPLDLT